MNTALSHPIRRRSTRRSATRTFVRHYVEMLIAMGIGMAVLGGLAAVALSVAGSGSAQLKVDAPAVFLLAMAFYMTAPMVGWMRHRGHGWRASSEMAASMFLPTFGAIALLAAGLVTETETLMLIQHVVMFPSMLVAMLARREEYS